MTGERVVRRLAAILAADVTGYSRLVGADELGTLTRLQLHWDTLIEPTIRSHHVRIVRIAGDGVLAGEGAAGRETVPRRKAHDYA